MERFERDSRSLRTGPSSTGEKEGQREREKEKGEERERGGPVNCENLGQPEAVFSWRRFSSVAEMIAGTSL